MKLTASLLFLTLTWATAWGQSVSSLVKEAVSLELQGQLGEALDRYRKALTADPTLADDTAFSRPMTVTVMSKIAHLCLDLGLSEEAWDVSTRLLAAHNQRAAEAGLIVRLRGLRLLGKGAERQASYDSFHKRWPQVPSSAVVWNELGRTASTGSGPDQWLTTGRAQRLFSPVDAYGLSLVESTRLSLGAFSDWNNALTLVDILREKGWSPVTEVRTRKDGATLHVVYVVSRNPEIDRKRLTAEGFDPGL